MSWIAGSAENAASSYVTMPSGLIVPEHHARRAAKPRLKAMDFFAGVGGLSLGMIQAGIEVVAMVEYDVTAACTYMVNLCRYGEVTMHFVEESDRDRMEKELRREWKRRGCKFGADGLPAEDGRADFRPLSTAGSGWISHQPASTPGVKHVFIGDVRKLGSQRILTALGMQPGDLDVVAGGPPCQGFSRAGKQDIMDPRNSLVFEFARFIVELHPKTMVMEEVPAILDMVTPEGLPVVEAFCRILQDGGFDELDSIRRCLAQQTGRVGLLRKGKGQPRREEAEKAGKATSNQIDMFEATASELVTADVGGGA